MFKKLDKMLERYDKLNELVSDSDVISRINEWKEYTKELAEITETVEKYTEYKKVVKEVVKDIQRALIQSDVNIQLVLKLSKTIEAARERIFGPMKGLDCRSFIIVRRITLVEGDI